MDSPDLSHGTGTPGWIDRIYDYCASRSDFVSGTIDDRTRDLFIQLLSDLRLAVPEVFEAALAKLLAEGASPEGGGAS